MQGHSDDFQPKAGQYVEFQIDGDAGSDGASDIRRLRWSTT